MSAEHATATQARDSVPRIPADRPAAIQVEDLKKGFRIPTQRVDSLKERMTHPFAAREYRELKALNGISFEIRQGEFFGIVGRNGSGKSTLMKLIASIYEADAGKIRVAGRLAPFIELGVGFNVELSARENVILNGVMMGLTPAEARSRLDAVIEFAELEEFIDLKLKNYSSGMLVRLSFSLMLQADADVLLIDEVLAVGDASFQQKCADAFRTMKGEGKTIVLVTHEMAAVETYCDRAMLIADGKIEGLGDPGEIASKYLRLNFSGPADGSHASPPVPGSKQPDLEDDIKLIGAWVENKDGERTNSVEHGAPIRLLAEVEAKQEVLGMAIGFTITNADGLGMFEFGGPVEEDSRGTLKPGQRVRIETSVENPLAAGRYFVHCGVHRQPVGGTNLVLYEENATDFVVFGGSGLRGVLSLEYQVDFFVDGEESSR
jgi:ABC-type polysaccharide/polyol phosphate transport system ATPase subunit